MKGNRLSIFAVVTVVVVVTAVIASRQDAPQTRQEKALLFPDASDKINNLGEVIIKSGEQSVSLLKQDTQWVIREADDYPATFSKIKEIAVAVTDLRVLAEKTNKPELYAKLGVEDPESDGVSSSLLTLKDNQQNPLLALIVGKNRQNKAGGGKPGLYVRLPESDRALLVEGGLDIALNINDWFEREVLNIDADRIRVIQIKHADEETVQVQRESKDDEFSLSQVPADRNADSSEIGRMSSLLESIYVDNVKAESKIAFPDDAIVTRVETFDGLVTTVTSAEVKDSSYIKLTIDYNEPVPESAEPVKEEGEQQAVSEDDASAESDTKADARQEAEELKQRVSGWVYEIPGYKFESYRKRMEDLLEEPETEDNDSSDEAG